MAARNERNRGNSEKRNDLIQEGFKGSIFKQRMPTERNSNPA